LIRRIEEVGAAFDYLRLRGISQAALAGRLGISTQRLHKIQNGWIAAPDEFVARVAEVLGVPVDRTYAAGDLANEEVRRGRLAG
jgi:transcriptional regulator with XRE-family HTH domain